MVFVQNLRCWPPWNHGFTQYCSGYQQRCQQHRAPCTEKKLKNLFSVKNKVRVKNIIIDVTLIDIKDFITMKVNNSSMFCVFLFSSKFFNAFSVSDWQS